MLVSHIPFNRPIFMFLELYISLFILVPPTYQEAVNACRVQVDADETFSVQRSEYVPKYPVYNFEVDSNKTDLQQFNIVE